MSKKKYDGCRSYAYLKAGEDYQAIPLAKEVDRVPSAKVELSVDGMENPSRRCATRCAGR